MFHLIVLISLWSSALGIDPDIKKIPSISWDNRFINIPDNMRLKSDELREIRGEKETELAQEQYKPKKFSPLSLDLLTTDGQSDKYLAKQGLHKSMSELLTQGQPKPVRNGFLPDCGAVKDGNKVLFVNCPGEIVVVSLAGSLKMTCREMEARRLFGPIYIRGEDCGQSLLYKWDCQDIKSLGASSTRCSDDPLHPWEYIMLVFGATFFLMTCLLLIFLCKVTKLESKIAEKYPMEVKRGCIKYTVMSFINADGDKEYCDPRINMPMNGVKEERKRSLLILFFLMLLCKPWSIESYEISSHIALKNGMHMYSLIIGESEIIPVGVDNISRGKVWHTSQLVKMFDTYDWSIRVKQNYYCQWKSCDKLMHCRQGVLPFQNVSGEIVYFLELEHTSPVFATCQRQEHMCEFGWGCIVIGFNLMTEKNRNYQVFSITKGGDHGGKIHSPVGCHVESQSSLLTGGIEDHYLVSSADSGNYLCHKLLFSLKPL